MGWPCEAQTRCALWGGHNLTAQASLRAYPGYLRVWCPPSLHFHPNLRCGTVSVNTLPDCTWLQPAVIVMAYGVIQQFHGINIKDYLHEEATGVGFSEIVYDMLCTE